MSIAGWIGEVLGLNFDLCMAGAAGHDIGHVPFGHVGEKFLTEKLGRSFRHEVFSVIVAEQIERSGAGLHLTIPTLQCILYHSRGSGELATIEGIPPEANVVMFADKIAYLMADYNDFLRAQLEINSRLKALMEDCGPNQRRRVKYLTDQLCQESAEQGMVSFSRSEGAKLLRDIKEEMYKLYGKFNTFGALELLDRVFNFIAHVERNEEKPLDPALVLALMTDDDVLRLNKPCLDICELAGTSVYELLPVLQNLTIDLTDPKMNL